MHESLVFGHNPQQRIVGIHTHNDNKMRIYVRTDNVTEAFDYNFFPFFFISDNHYIENFEKKYFIKKLSGENFYQYIVAFNRWLDMWDCVHHILKIYNQENPHSACSSYENLPILYLINNKINQYLIQSGKTFYKGMEFSELRRLQLSIEIQKKTTSKSGDLRRESDRIIFVALRSSNGFNLILGEKEKSEKDLLAKLVSTIINYDPDIIEGYALHEYLLPYIIKRCELKNIPFTIGRDGSIPKPIETPYQSKEITSKNKYTCPGRQLIDIVTLLQEYDPSKKFFTKHNLIDIGEHFGFKIDIKKNEATDAKEILLQNNNIISHITDLLLPSFFLQSKIFPYSISQLIETNSSLKIESILLREYVHKKHSIPKPQQPRTIAGGYTDIFYTGVFNDVYYADVESMYPSIMLLNKIKPDSDKLDVYQNILKSLTEIRLQNKKEASEHTNKLKYHYLQTDFKNLTNAFYGYLAYQKGIFNDYDKANKISELGREIIKKIMSLIEQNNGKIIEVDTDGIFFTLYSDNEAKVNILIEEINKSLPREINFVLAKKYKKFLSYRKKNYATLSYEDKIQIKGSALISRAMERFGKNLIQHGIDCLLRENFYGLHIFYKNLYHDIVERKWSIKDFMRVENLKEPIYKYINEIKNESRNRNAAYELAIKSGMDYKVGDHISFYITGTEASVKTFENCKFAEEWDPNFPDENTAYYLKRLEEYTRKFEDFFTKEDFNKIFSTEKVKQEDFDKIKLQVIEVKKEKAPDADEDGFGIWLAE